MKKVKTKYGVHFPFPFKEWARSPEVLQDSLLKEWDQSDVDPQKFKRTIRSS